MNIEFDIPNLKQRIKACYTFLLIARQILFTGKATLAINAQVENVMPQGTENFNQNFMYN